MHRTLLLLTLTGLLGAGLVACSTGTSRIPEDPQEAAALVFALETRLQRAYLDELLASRRWNGEGPPPWERPESRLGEELFFDPVLSVDGSTSCATCHDPRLAFTDGRTVFRGLDDFLGQRNTPTILNVGLMRELFWDGRARDLEEQADLVITSPVEMGHPSVAAAARELAARPHYDAAFRKVFGTPPPPPRCAPPWRSSSAAWSSWTPPWTGSWRGTTAPWTPPRSAGGSCSGGAPCAPPAT